MASMIFTENPLRVYGVPITMGSSRQKKVNCVSCGYLEELDRQISESADYPDEGSGCEKLSHWQRMDVRAEVGRISLSRFPG
jgi:hypothetical protein